MSADAQAKMIAEVSSCFRESGLAVSFQNDRYGDGVAFHVSENGRRIHSSAVYFHDPAAVKASAMRFLAERNRGVSPHAESVMVGDQHFVRNLNESDEDFRKRIQASLGSVFVTNEEQRDRFDFDRLLRPLAFLDGDE